MANANWANPTLTSNYTSVLTDLKNRDEDLALQFDGSSATSFPTGTIRWSSSANRWQKWTGSAWGELTGTYALTSLTTTGNVTIGGTLTVSTGLVLSTATAATPAVDNNSTSVATTAYVIGQAGSTTPTSNGVGAAGSSLRYSRQDHVHGTDTTRAPLASPTFTGTPVVPSLNGGQLAGFRNRVINGAMTIDCRNSGATASCPAGALTYVIDRYFAYAVGSALIAQKVGISYNGLTSALRVTGAAGNTVCVIGQRIESYNSADLAGKTVTLSFYAGTSSTRSVYINLYYANAFDNFSANTTIGTVGVTFTSSYAYYTATFAVPSGATNGLTFDIGISGGMTSGTMDVFGVQLELGSQATPFEFRNHAIELAACQRYYYRPDTIFTNQSYGVTGSNSNFPFYFPCQMRTTPTITAAWSGLVGCTNGAIGARGTTGAVAAITRTAAGAGDYSGDITWTSFNAELG